MTTRSRWAAVAAVGLIATLAACGSADPAPSGAPSATQDGGSRHTDEGSSRYSAAAKEFCTRYNEYMGEMLKGGEAAEAAVPKFDALIDGAPDEFRKWTKDIAPWAKAMVDDTIGSLEEEAVDASEEAGYQVSNRCQFVLADI